MLRAFAVLFLDDVLFISLFISMSVFAEIESVTFPPCFSMTDFNSALFLNFVSFPVMTIVFPERLSFI